MSEDADALAEQPTLPPSGRGAEFAILPLAQQLGRYRVEKLLGQGGMGAVYEAHDTRLDRPVALKVQRLEGKMAAIGTARALREARAAAALQHPNICPIHDCGEIDRTFYLVMALIRGPTLTQRLRASPPLTISESIALVQKTAAAMAHAHEHGVIHRDLKPGNIMLNEHGEPVIMDFGLARLDTPLATQLTQQGEVLGTPSYMSPEQINGEVAAIGPATDIYSLGVVFYELLTGAVPFHGDLIALATQISLDPPPLPSVVKPELGSRLDALCIRALAKKPGERWPSMRAFGEALGQYLGTLAGKRAIAEPPRLTLHVVGTPYAYRARPGQTRITLGRQKRRPTEPLTSGNDMVLRIVGNDELSARISRRHCEILYDGRGFHIIDYSKAGTEHNGQLLPSDTAVPLADGDRLVVAGVVTLAVRLHVGARAAAPQGEVQVTARGAAAPVVLEATCGDLVTLDMPEGE